VIQQQLMIILNTLTEPEKTTNKSSKAAKSFIHILMSPQRSLIANV
jgi:hypothetical protein